MLHKSAGKKYVDEVPVINLYFVFILDFSLELEQEDTDSINKLLYTLNHKREYYHKL